MSSYKYFFSTHIDKLKRRVELEVLKMKSESAEESEKVKGNLINDAVDDFGGTQNKVSPNCVVHIKESFDMALAIESQRAPQSAENSKKNLLEYQKMALAIQESRKALQYRKSLRKDFKSFCDDRKDYRRKFAFSSASEMAKEATVRRNVAKKVTQESKEEAELLAIM